MNSERKQVHRITYDALAVSTRSEEIALVTRLMAEALRRSGPLSQSEIDELLKRNPIVVPSQRHSD